MTGTGSLKNFFGWSSNGRLETLSIISATASSLPLGLNPITGALIYTTYSTNLGMMGLRGAVDTSGAIIMLSPYVRYSSTDCETCDTTTPYTYST